MLLWLAVAVIGCGSGAKKLSLGAGCVLNTDCNNPLACKFMKCHRACNESPDCDPGQRCVKVDGIGVCQLPAEASFVCGASNACTQPLVCGPDSKCRNSCTVKTDCIGRQTCVTDAVSGKSVCADTNETLIPVDGGATGGADGGAGATGTGGSMDAVSIDVATSDVVADSAVDGPAPDLAPDGTPNAGAGSDAASDATSDGPVTGTVFTNEADWKTQALSAPTLIDFDNLAAGAMPAGAYAALPGAPAFVSVKGEGVVIAEAAVTYQQVPTAPSGTKYLIPIVVSDQLEPAEGIIRIDFNAPVRAFAGTFIDVEADFASTGFGLTEPLPLFAFSQRPTSAFAFLGVVFSRPVLSVEIHFATAPTIDGTGVDNLQYVLAP